MSWSVQRTYDFMLVNITQVANSDSCALLLSCHVCLFCGSQVFIAHTHTHTHTHTHAHAHTSIPVVQQN
jgi:hypothetical protein